MIEAGHWMQKHTLCFVSPHRFTDLAQNFSLSRGKGSRDPEDVGSVGLFKGTVKMYPLPDDGSPEPKPLLANIPSTDPIEVVVRVYIIRVSLLAPLNKVSPS